MSVMESKVSTGVYHVWTPIAARTMLQPSFRDRSLSLLPMLAISAISRSWAMHLAYVYARTMSFTLNVSASSSKTNGAASQSALISSTVHYVRSPCRLIIRCQSWGLSTKSGSTTELTSRKLQFSSSSSQVCTDQEDSKTPMIRSMET